MTGEVLRRGAYGFTVGGIPDAGELLVEAPPSWRQLDISVTALAASAFGTESVDDSHAVVRLRSGGWVTIDRAARKAVFAMNRPPSPAALVHPHLAAVAVVQAHWDERDSFHAGAFVADGGVWGVLGEKGAGKSSILAGLAERGVPVMADDVLVLSEAMALAGPRSIDLRTAAARELSRGQPLGMIGGRERWRVSLDPVPAELPFRGWVELRWGTEVRLRTKHGSERLRTLLPHRGLRVPPPHPERMLQLAGLPVLELHRPPEWSSHQSSIEALLESISGLGDPSRLQQRE